MGRELVKSPGVLVCALLTLSTGCAQNGGPAASATAPESLLRVTPSTSPRLAQVSDRFLSYNVEMVEVTGGNFWAPYDKAMRDVTSPSALPKGPPVGRHAYRPPIDLKDARLRKLAGALGPAYVRYSGTWANATYFPETPDFTGSAPAGFDTVLTHAQWRGAIEFAKAVDARIVTSMATSPGARNAQGVWQSDNAERLLRFTKRVGGQIAASEFANEPNIISYTQPPPNYSTADYRRDYARFHSWIRQNSPETLVLAPGAVELGQRANATTPPRPSTITLWDSKDLLEDGSARPDVVSFHFYGGTSLRCAGTEKSKAMDDSWLSLIDYGIKRAAAVRDRYAPGAPLWDTETGETGCGGNPWAKTFTDTFRFVDVLGRSARQGVEVFFHNTLAAGDYALLDEETFAPRPNYWVAYVWRKLMGETVLDAGASTATLRVYGHCQRNVAGGVTLLAINTDAKREQSIQLKGRGSIYSLTEGPDGPDEISLNGTKLALLADDSLPRLAGKSVSGTLRLAPASINFIAVPNARNPVCQSKAGS